MVRNNTLNIAYNAVFTAIALVLGFVGRLSVFPVFPFLKLDFSDIPVFLSAIVLGAPYGVMALLVASALRTLLFSSSGWIGFAIRFTSVIVIMFIGWFYKSKFSPAAKMFGLIAGSVLCLAVKLTLNCFFWINCFSIFQEVLNVYMLTIILPYNILKIAITLSCALFLEKPVKKLMACH